MRKLIASTFVSLDGIMQAPGAKKTSGIQIATLYNQADEMKRLQIGFVDVFQWMTGVQIGIANIIKESKLPFFPIVNASF
ncbi:hypothetical protein [Geoalkalibacter halelectricus]|uniref:hypothetical protein n=1 Tax=Geoalkalibacter halelectricus TaxID=2847045 RepID=UPI003D1A6130